MSGLPITEEVTPELEAWLDYNQGVGCSLDDLGATLIESGYRADDVAAFLLRRRGASPVRNAAEATQRFWRRLDALASINSVWVGDRACPIVARSPGAGILLVADVLSDDERAALVAEAEPNLTDALILDEGDGDIAASGSRVCRGAGLARCGSDIVRRVERRIEVLTGLPLAHGEDLQVLHYPTGGEYRPHVDYFDPDTAGGRQMLARGPQRLATAILYLSDVEAGGGTQFPALSLEFSATAGSALLFASLDREGRPMPASLHWGRPVTSGEKWIATKWIRTEAI